MMIRELMDGVLPRRSVQLFVSHPEYKTPCI
jgi:hypothetical protein